MCLDKDAEVRAQLKFYSNWKKNDAINVLKGEKKIHDLSTLLRMSDCPLMEGEF